VRATSVNTPDWITVTGIPYLLRLKSGLRRPSNRENLNSLAALLESGDVKVVIDKLYPLSRAADVAHMLGTRGKVVIAA
jgi:NADPH:quinone reductase-like Zn-dependent oxidoreductase